jgi:hypothetical protein
MASWTEVCEAALGRSQQALSEMTLTCSGILVSWDGISNSHLINKHAIRVVPCNMAAWLLTRFALLNQIDNLLTLIRSLHQIAAFCACAAASGVMFMRWRRLDHDSRQPLWSLYGWFSGLICCGSCIGAVTWAAWMQFLLAYYPSNTGTRTRSDSAEALAEAHSLYARVSCVCLAPARIRACTAARVR